MNIYVGNLSRDVSTEDLRQAFEAHGEVSSVNIIKDKYSGEPRGFGFVEMPNKAEAQTAIENLNGSDLLGQQMNVNEALIKKTVLDLGTQFTQVEIREISEDCKINKSSIIGVVLKMIENEEIYGEYFSSSKSISFNQQANIDEIDNLMAKYTEWEEQQVEKV